MINIITTSIFQIDLFNFCGFPATLGYMVTKWPISQPNLQPPQSYLLLNYLRLILSLFYAGTFSTFGPTNGIICPLVLLPNTKSPFPKIYYNKSWFSNLNLPRSTTVRFNRLRVGHSLLPDHAYKLGLNDSPLCTLYSSESISDFQHLLFHCPFLRSERLFLLNSLSAFNIPPNLFSSLNTNSEIIINKIIKFILDAGFAI